jgi:hypothetical protein
MSTSERERERHKICEARHRTCDDDDEKIVKVKKENF